MEGVSLLPSVVLTKEVIMRQVKLVVHECYAGKQKSEEVNAAVFLSNAAALTESKFLWVDSATPPHNPAKERSFPPNGSCALT